MTQAISSVLNGGFNAVMFGAGAIAGTAELVAEKIQRLASEIELSIKFAAERRGFYANLTNYFPTQNDALIANSKDATIEPFDKESECAFAALSTELIWMVALKLDPVSFAQFSQVCKCLHLISKEPLFWEGLFKEYLFKVSPSKLSSYSVEQQFKLIFKVFAYDRVKLKLQVSSIKQEASQLYSQLEHCRQMFDYFKKICFTDGFYTDENSPYGHNLDDYRLQEKELESRLKALVGSSYSGTDESAGKNSTLRRVLNAILEVKQLIPDYGQITVEQFLSQIERKNSTTLAILFMFGKTKFIRQIILRYSM